MAEALQALKLPELKEECRKLGLPVTGKKSELIDRILQAQGQELPADANGAGAEHDDAMEEEEGGAADDPQAAAAAAPAQPAAAAAPVAAEQAAEAPASEQPPSKHARIMFPSAAAAPSAAAEPQAAAPKVISLAKPVQAAAAPAQAAATKADLEKIKVLTAEERAALRADKFKGAQGTAADDDKIKERAVRFGLAAPQPNPADDETKKAERRKRFNIQNDQDKAAAKAKEKLELLGDEETRKRRLERFGKAADKEEKVQEGDKPAIDDPEKIKERTKRFGVVSLSAEARKKARLERFAKGTAQ